MKQKLTLYPSIEFVKLLLSHANVYIYEVARIPLPNSFWPPALAMRKLLKKKISISE